MKEPDNWMLPDQLVGWAKANLNIMKLNIQMTDEEISRTMRWVGECSVDTSYLDGDKPHLGRIGINNMLFVTLLEFPEYYMKYELSQFN